MWFHSQLKDVVNNIEQHIYKDYYNDLVYLATRQNYMKLIELCDYLCVTNVDILIDKIVDLYDTNLHQFKDFYGLSQRLQRTNDYLKNGDIFYMFCHIILNWDKNKRCFRAYGHISYYDVSIFTLWVVYF